MSRASRLANHIERTVTGPMWHGPALKDVLDGVDAARARARPIAGAHSIWEIVLHVAAWADIARQRIHGECLGDPAPEQDWPPAGGDWPQVIERLTESHRRLADDVRQLDDAALDAKVKTLDYPVGILLDGVVEHGTYHGGQIALLKKA
ncbi:MAG TPA: DinB family protein [Vicinamibacterales bacterium]|nr:DinB family protein [Vicinamibacterales bacterium]